jgi:uncharacterized membrane protein (UPF0127 family)
VKAPSPFERFEPLVPLPEGLPPRLRQYLEPLTTERGRSKLNWVVGVLAALTFLAFLGIGADTPANPQLGAPTTTTSLPAPKPSRIAGFDEVFFQLTQFGGQPGSSKHFCGVRAATPEQQAKGLMGRKDLAGYDAMVFTFASDTDTPFYMKGVTVPLSIAFFDSAGRFLGSLDMQPCPKIRNCPLYSLPGGFKYRTAIEVAQGGLARLGAGGGSTLSAGGGCV